jgi:putative transposase
VQYKSYKIRIEANNKQKSLFAKHAGTARHAYNIALSYCNDLFKNGEKIPSAIDLHKWLVAIVKQENKWYYEVSKYTPQQALRNLETAFKNFHTLQKKSQYKLLHYKTVNGVKISTGLQGLPRFKKKGQNDSFYLEGAIRFKDNKIKLPKIGWVKLSESLDIDTIKNCTISRKANQWYISFKTEYIPVKTVKKHDAVGIDLGIKTLATLSNGEVFKNQKPYKNAKTKLRKQQKEVSRRYKKGAESQSSNYKKSVQKLAKTHAMIANIRKDAIHKITSYLAKNFETVVIENLKVKNMSKNKKLASAILDGGFFEFKRQLEYKKIWYGGKVIIADTFYPSSKLCSNCGNKKDNLKLSERKYICDSCNFEIDRDLNASINLEKLAVSSTVTAFGDGSSAQFCVQPVDELGIKHQMLTFV